MFCRQSSSAYGGLTSRKCALLALILSIFTFLLLFANVNLASAQENADSRECSSIDTIKVIPSPYSLIPSPSLSDNSDQEVSKDGSRVTMFRLYNQWTGEHFYTSSISERDEITKAGWKQEGVGWYAPTSENFKPVYRLYNSYVEGGDHHYTISADEKDECVKAGWSYEGEGWRTVDEGATDYVKVLRQYNPYAATGTHNYTTNIEEQDKIVKAGWRAEGVGWGGYSKLEPTTPTPTPTSTFTVTFNSNGGTAVAKQTVQSGKTAIKPANPTREGYTFVAWCTDSACTKTFDFSTKITKNITLYAKWNQKSYKITFNTNGGSAVADQTVFYGNTVNKPADPTKSGFGFGGWYSDKNLTREFDFSTKITANITLYARWGISIDVADVRLGDDLAYIGEEQTQVVTEVLMPDRKLVEGTDYKVLNNKVTDAGDYTLTVQGIGTYAGTKTINFSVAKRELYISYPNTELTYNGKKQGPVGEAGMGLIDSDKGKVIVGITEETMQINASDTEYVGVPALTGARAFNYYIHPGATSINFKINKADPTLEGLSTIYAEADQVLSDIALPHFDNGVLTWDSPATSIGDFEGVKKFPATFTPNDQNNYNTISVEVSIKLGAAKTDSYGVAAVDNPKDGVSYFVLVTGYSSRTDKDNVAQAVVYFDDSGSLVVKMPSDASMDARDPKIQIQTQGGSVVSNVPVVVNKSYGEKIGSGKTDSQGYFYTHNGVKTTTVSYGSCKCTSPSKVTKTCPVCAEEFSSEFVEAGGHPKDKIVAYGVNSVAKECQECGHVLFGTWEQDGNEKNGKEAIEWMKLGDQELDGTQLLVSLNILEKKAFDTSASSLWQMSSLRRWLNIDSGGFYDSAFTNTEKTAIETTMLSDLNYSANIFLLSKDQANNTNYFADREARKCYFLRDRGSDYCYWWLRTPGGHGGTSTNPTSADFVGSNGNVDDASGTLSSAVNLGVRPALTFKAAEPKKVNVSFKAEGVSAADLPQTQELNQGEVLKSVPEVSRAGYTFVGWYKTGDSSQVLIDRTTTFFEDTELTALWATSESYARTDSNGVAELKNPYTNESVKVTVKSAWFLINKDFFTTSVSSAVVSFSDDGNLNVKAPNCYRRDIRVSVAKQSDGSAIVGQPCNVYYAGSDEDSERGDPHFLMSGETASASDVREIISAGDFWAHWDTQTITEVDGTCDCTKTTYESQQCAICNLAVTRKVTAAPAGHPQDQLVDYGADSTAKECKKCGHVLFGTWEQDGDEASKETIEWLKLGDQTSNGTQLLLSLYALEYKQFDPSGIMWSSSQIRSWLNTDADGFYSSAFTTSEKSKVNETTLSDVSSTDNVFLLSESDAGNTAYFKDEDARACYMTPAIFDKSFMTYSRISSWWLRSTRTIASGTGVANIYKNNITGDKPTCVLGIRPALNFKVSETS